ncbi:hypothetical protein SERLA73DRAFT_190854 [Serpula lacrymans var. lacrymans S7.3]|uniref:BTB domain-containing protein n=2 Tax=Serpula lacrymans var. lacrymans TaxID=341189 RepID=F8QGI3_SERL3|nr:uncharacterized protein SERLADRAFT_456821 [Serpula lacrymans var. lacrymans S7.9]EGN92529.1 hypothetical protein SERLA73DRAFT_190854 [Serpula lacrymans var. lacrymans S7.3]EGO29276.1 hypothetical protein SERLADRAFT_456821 [Serpula lacrymans var. lacrymans S7.9]
MDIDPVQTNIDPNTASEVKICERFSASDSDITIRSSDGVLFRVHRKNLTMHSEIFPGEELEAKDDVDLDESSAVLELLFQFMYRQAQPKLSETSFSVLESLANAVEKYRVFPGIEVCRMHMKANAGMSPLKVIKYAVKHGYHDVCDAAAPKSLNASLSEARECLDMSCLVAWMIYRDSVMSALHRSPGIVMHRGGKKTCSAWDEFYAHSISAFAGRPAQVFDYARIIGHWKLRLSDCHWCLQRAGQWEATIQANLSRVPKISSLITL